MNTNEEKELFNTIINRAMSQGMTDDEKELCDISEIMLKELTEVYTKYHTTNGGKLSSLHNLTLINVVDSETNGPAIAGPNNIYEIKRTFY